MELHASRALGLGMTPLVNRTVLGRCSLCGGLVSIFNGAWYGTQPPTARCEQCGSGPAPMMMPVIPMVPRPSIPGTCEIVHEEVRFTDAVGVNGCKATAECSA
jgi:hypothetical protein